MDKKFGVFINKKAGKGKPRVFSKLLQEELKKHALQYEMYENEWPDSLEGLTDVFVVGGDGTLNYFINKYPDCSVPITIIRSGSGNDFHKELFGKKKDFKRNFETALHGEILPIDAGNCNGKWFLNGCGIGFDGRVVRSMKHKRSKSFGLSAYLVHTLKNLFFYRSGKYSIRYNGSSLNMKALMITVANGAKYGGGFMVAPGAKINDGRLNLVIIQQLHPLKRLIHLPKLKTGKHIELSITSDHLVESVTIDAEKPMDAHVDGEYFSSNHFKIEVYKNKFLFRVPSSNEDI
jgi:diacylglycerol kinase (ATP)